MSNNINEFVSNELFQEIENEEASIISGGFFSVPNPIDVVKSGVDTVVDVGGTVVNTVDNTIGWPTLVEIMLRRGGKNIPV